MMKLFRILSSDKDLIQNKTVKLGKYRYGIEPIQNKPGLVAFKSSVGRINSYVIKKKIEYRDISTLIDKISRSNSCSFKGCDKSKLVKVYIDHEVFYTRTKGRLKVKSGKFKTNIEWLRTRLIDMGLTDITPNTKSWK